jgi:predicted nucleic acid-binding protein
LAVKTALIDTGPLVAYLNRRDAAHGEVTASLESFTGRLVTTSAVVGEVMYFVSEFANGPISFARLIMDSHIHVAETGPPARILAAAELMSRYSGLPMDFADATLVLLAAELGVIDIFTLDRRGFTTYRTPKGKSFRIMIAP